jgi:hypothetical protein
LQRIQRGVIEDFPPFAPKDLVLRLSGFPATGLFGAARRKFLVRVRNLRAGPGVFWADRARAGKEQ